MLQIILLCYCLNAQIYSVVANENCEELPTLIYEELNCEIAKTDDNNCPIAYKCNFETNSDFCLFQSKRYEINEKINWQLTYGACEISCVCMKQYEHKNASFDCAVLDCPEWLGWEPKENCYLKYELNKCCAVGEICEDPNTVPKCEYDGETYLQGQLIYPRDTCKSCICDEDFSINSTKHCTPLQCSPQLKKNYNSLSNYCAPLYIKEAMKCCPLQWICPDEIDSLEIISENTNPKLDLQCRFGNVTMKLGESFQANIEDKIMSMECKCLVPPLLTCEF